MKHESLMSHCLQSWLIIRSRATLRSFKHKNANSTIDQPVLSFFAPRINQTRIENRESVNYVHIYLSHRHVWQNVAFTGCQRERENQAAIYRSFRLSDESKTETLDSCINSMMEHFFSRHVKRSFLSRTTSLNFPPTQARRQDTNLMLVSVPVVSKQPSQIFLSPTHQLFLFFLRPHFPSLVFCYFCDAKKNISSRRKILFTPYRWPRAALMASPTSPIALRLCLPCFFK